MLIGIGLPATIPGVKGPDILEWDRRADSGPFSSLRIIDRLVSPNFEPLVTLAAAAGGTRRIRQMSTILVAPLRNTGHLAKQAASLDALSGGKLTLRPGIGRRKDAFQAAPARFKNRGRLFKQQLEWMRCIWSGQSPADGLGTAGLQPVRSGGSEVLIGGYSPTAIQRVDVGEMVKSLEAAEIQPAFANCTALPRNNGRRMIALDSRASSKPSTAPFARTLLIRPRLTFEITIVLRARRRRI